MVNQQKIPEGWKETKLGDVVKIFGGAAFNSNDATDFGVKWLKIANVGIQKIKWSIKSYLPNSFLEEFQKYKISNGDIVVALTRPTLNNKLKIAVMEDDDGIALLNQRVGKLEFSKSINNKFAYNILIKEETAFRLNQMLLGTDPPNLNSSAFNFIKLLLPPLPEQNRIVEVLETWDKYLQKLDQKIKIKKNIKKGLMQNLLTGKIRLKNFKENWCEVRLNDLGQTYSGLTNKREKDFGVGKKFITYMNIYLNSSINIDIKDLVDVKKEEKQSLVKYGDIFFTTSSETPDEVGISSVLLDKNFQELYLNSFCFGFRLFNFKKLIPEFSKYFFRGQEFRKKMFRIAQGATRYNLSKKYFLEERIVIPSNIDEQNAIADVLMAADKEIETLEKQREIIKNQKIYLLNNLITGQIRLPEFVTKN